MNWQPTCEMRWQERHPNYNLITGEHFKVLQQKWIDHPNPELADEEWRDVPTEKPE